MKNDKAKFKILEHPADLKIQAFGKDLAEVFINIAEAIAGQQIQDLEIKKLRNLEIEEVVMESADLESLLVDWLSEILYRGEINKKVYTDFEILEFSEKPARIKAKIKGIPVEKKDIDIKAVTYHDLEIKKANKHWEAQVIFDI